LNKKNDLKNDTILEESSIISAISLTSEFEDISHLMYMSIYINVNYVLDDFLFLNKRSKNEDSLCNDKDWINLLTMAEKLVQMTGIVNQIRDKKKLEKINPILFSIVRV